MQMHSDNQQLYPGFIHYWILVLWQYKGRGMEINITMYAKSEPFNLFNPLNISNKIDNRI